MRKKKFTFINFYVSNHVYLSLCLLACLPTCQFCYLSIYSSLHLHVSRSNCLLLFLSMFMYVFLKPMLLLNKKAKYALELHVSSALKHELLLLFITRSFAIHIRKMKLITSRTATFQK